MILRKNIHRVFFFTLLALSIGLIFYQFPFIPANLSFDEVEFAKLALSLQNQPYTPYSTLATGHSTLYFYIILTALQIFGVTNFALRLPAAIFGVINVLLTYVLMRQVFAHLIEKKDELLREIIPAVLSLTLLTMHWYFNFTRFSFEATFLLSLELSSLIFLLYFKEFQQNIYLSLSGLFAGLAYLSYTPGRLFFLVPLVFLAYFLRKRLVTIMYFVIPLIIIIIPLNLYLTQNPDIRINQLSYLNNDQLYLGEKIEFFTRNVISTAGMFHFEGDLNGRQNYPGKPAMNLILGLFFLGGLIISILKRRPYDLLFLFYFIISLFPALLTYPQENPHMLRTFTALIPVIYFIGRALLTLAKIQQVKRNYLWLFLAVLLLFSVVYELRTYFVYQTQVFPEAFEMKGGLAELIHKLPATSPPVDQ